MFTGTPDELHEREAQALALATQAAETLNQIEALGLGTVTGTLRFPGGQIRRREDGWTAD
ncbi:hypothetical protein ACWGN5_40165 [Streptomyces sp. NPDC055815]